MLVPKWATLLVQLNLKNNTYSTFYKKNRLWEMSIKLSAGTRLGLLWYLLLIPKY